MASVARLRPSCESEPERRVRLSECEACRGRRRGNRARRDEHDERRAGESGQRELPEREVARRGTEPGRERQRGDEREKRQRRSAPRIAAAASASSAGREQRGPNRRGVAYGNRAKTLHASSVCGGPTNGNISSRARSTPATLRSAFQIAPP